LPIDSLHNEFRLIEEMQAGSEEAFAKLYRHYSPALYLNILKIVHDPASAEEIIQELFTRVWQKKEAKGLAENFQGYVFRIAQNLVHDFFRKVRRDQQLLERFRQLASTNYEDVEEQFHQKQSAAIVQKAIDQLSPQQKKAYELVKREGHTYKEAASLMGISPLTVKEYLAAARKSLREFLINNMDSPMMLVIYFIGKVI
jgi:RNA polymerase sigma-70 factor (ECF subfamily)